MIFLKKVYNFFEKVMFKIKGENPLIIKVYKYEVFCLVLLLGLEVF